MPLVANFIEDVLPYAEIVLHGVTEKRLPASIRDLLNLCGGIPSPDITHFKAEIYATYSSALTIKITSDQYEAVRSMDFSIGRLDNNFLFVNDQGKGLGTNLFLNQLQAARNFSFRRIKVTAMAPSEDEPHWTGYYFWACLGFQNSDVEEFQEWARAIGRKEATLSVLMQTKEGRECWKNNGFTWIGDFFLAQDHNCIYQLKNHLNRKGIDFLIE